MAFYLLGRYALAGCFRLAGQQTAELNIAGVVFDAATFAGSLLLLVGIYEPKVLRAIGEVKLYLLCAAFAGIIFTLKALRPPRQ